MQLGKRLLVHTECNQRPDWYHIPNPYFVLHNYYKSSESHLHTERGKKKKNIGLKKLFREIFSFFGF